MNTCILVGTITSELELRYATTGTPVARWQLTSTTPGETAEHQCVLTAVSFGARAEQLARELSRGARLLVLGTLRSAERTGQTGRTYYVYELVVQQWQRID